jgi:hypothetical protein
VLGRLGELVEQLENGRRWQILGLLATGPLSEAELGRHFRFRLTLGWHLRELHALGLVAYNRRAGRYHLIRPAVEVLADFCAQLDEASGAPAERLAFERTDGSGPVVGPRAAGRRRPAALGLR